MDDRHNSYSLGGGGVLKVLIIEPRLILLPPYMGALNPEGFPPEAALKSVIFTQTTKYNYVSRFLHLMEFLWA